MKIDFIPAEAHDGATEKFRDGIGRTALLSDRYIPVPVNVRFINQ
jgi:hypothetical protein